MSNSTLFMSARTRSEFRAGWRVLLAAFIGNALSAGTLGFYSLGVLTPALHESFGWGAGAIAGGLLAMTIGTLIASPLIGLTVDRVGVRPVVLASTLGLPLAFALFALLPVSLPLYYTLWALVALIGAGSFPMTWSRLVNQHFQTNRGLALGLSFVGTGLTGFLLKPLLFGAIAQHGWRAGFLVMAALAVIPFAAAFFLIPRAAPITATPAAVVRPLHGLSLNEALHSWRFWLLLFVVACAAIGVGGPLPNMESVLRGRGYSAAHAVAAAQIVGLSILFGRIVGGAMLDFIWAPAVGSAVLALGGLSCFGLCLAPGSGVQILLGVFLIGCASGLETDLLAYLVVRYFGLAAYGAIYGILYGLFAIGTGVGAIGFGLIADRTGGFGAGLAAYGAILSGAAGLILLLGRYRFARDA
jgi:predicted MFS family arabinose efflux permease